MNISLLEDEDLPNYKIIIVGRTQSGKTKLLTRYKFGNYTDDGAITLGVDSLVIKTDKAKFTYYDTAGQDKYKAIVSSYYKGSDGCILAYDVSSTKSFDDMAYYYNMVKQTIPDCLIYVVGCKGDL